MKPHRFRNLSDEKPLLRDREKRRGGAIVVMSAAMMVMILAMAAFSLDVGWISLTKAQMQNAVDAGALAAAMELNPYADQDDVEEAARQAAGQVAALHRAGDKPGVSLATGNGSVEFGRQSYDPDTGQTIYTWGKSARPYNMVKVTAEKQKIETGVSTDDRRLPLFFGPVIGHPKAPLETHAIATFQPRDIVLVLDYSASMNDDSELRSIGALGQSAVEDNIYQMWQDLGSPTYGNMGFWPDWVTVPGEDVDFDVTWKTDEVYVKKTGSKKIGAIYLEFANGSYGYWTTNTNSGTWKGTGGNNGQRITSAWVNDGDDWEEFDFYRNSTIRRGLGLDGVSYPSSGDWDDYIEYARSHSNNMPWYDGDVYSAGYRRKFGVLTLINFWNKNKPKHNQTPDLWKASQQPITALKDACDILLDYLVAVAAEDQVGLSIYTAADSHGLLESGLTHDYGLLKTISRQRQAGHYHTNTNIGAGMNKGRIELENNARPKAYRMMVLMTDGLANMTSTGASPADYAIDEAQYAAASGIKIMTISLGTGADTTLMQQIADITGGKHFNVPGGHGVAQYTAQLKQTFGEIAASRPLKLIEVP